MRLPTPMRATGRLRSSTRASVRPSGKLASCRATAPPSTSCTTCSTSSGGSPSRRFQAIRIRAMPPPSSRRVRWLSSNGAICTSTTPFVPEVESGWLLSGHPAGSVKLTLSMSSAVTPGPPGRRGRHPLGGITSTNRARWQLSARPLPPCVPQRLPTRSETEDAARSSASARRRCHVSGSCSRSRHSRSASDGALASHAGIALAASGPAAGKAVRQSGQRASPRRHTSPKQARQKRCPHEGRITASHRTS